MKRLYYLGKPADGFGWGVCNTNLVAALSKHCEVITDIPTERNRFDAPVFMPLQDGGLRPQRPVKAPKVLGYGFWEMPLDEEAARCNAGRYDWIFAGSEWCANRVRSASGATHVSALIQGVDLERFKPLPRKGTVGFRVFSGGKYEFRKGQDIVLAAMRVFMTIRQDVVLVTAWHNPWPDTARSMEQSWLINPAEPAAGLPQDRLFMLPQIANAQMPEVYAECDVGFFPNRCEGGTNLVMMEFMACGKPVIATSATGQGEVLAGGCFKVQQGSYDHAGWFNADVSSCLVELERAYQNRAQLSAMGTQARDSVASYTWERAAKEIAARAF